MRAPLAAPLADAIYDVLVECGASKALLDRAQFVVYVSTERNGEDGSREWRFAGRLGFGGKLYVASGRVYVGCYPESRTPERIALIEAANEKIAALVAVIE